MQRVLLVAASDTIAYRQHSSRPTIATGTELLAAAAAHTSVTDVHVEDVMEGALASSYSRR
jgi:L-asparaginase